MSYTDQVLAERQRQIDQGKSEDQGNLSWHIVVSDQLALITRTLSLARYQGLATKAGEPTLSATDKEAIRIGLVRLGACAMAWYEALEQ